MSELDNFIRIIRENSNEGRPLDIHQAREIVCELNNFLFTTRPELGELEISGENYRFFSSFHKYWHENYREILDLQISNNQCEAVAHVLHDVYLRTNGNAFRYIYDTINLSPEEICRVRFLTANQDFRGSRNFNNLAELYISDNSIFDETNIVDNPDDFLNQIGFQRLAQGDKRISYARNIAQFLIDNARTPYTIIDQYNRDVFAFRQALVNIRNAGYGNKKADMFIRDMVVLNVWPINTITGFEHINVASDINTIKVALRTGILTSAIPLVSSFLDIFGYQYSHVDEINALAWRRVYEKWNNLFPQECIISPCLLDYFIYDVIGKQICKENLYIFSGENCEHTFKWHSAVNKTCQICYSGGTNGMRARKIGKVKLCSDAEGCIAMRQTNFYRSNIANPNYDTCPLKIVCDAYNKKNLNPPKSISIMGQTGWTSGYSEEGDGGGGIMA